MAGAVGDWAGGVREDLPAGAGAGSRYGSRTAPSW
ncbi:hypothetical protein HU200_012893 [Digitaria exilis]|uniref:Uncharacterized protein n=1 Tax=Digitaria exilis TaxID=1010633 RepID=A0A835KK39_9POAL|nr:hypothetical protein HU200_012893 [Digitaria exilis]